MSVTSTQKKEFITAVKIFIASGPRFLSSSAETFNCLDWIEEVLRNGLRNCCDCSLTSLFKLLVAFKGIHDGMFEKLNMTI
jgi:hypothetical protein